MKQHHTISPDRARSCQRLLRAGALALATFAVAGTVPFVVSCERAAVENREPARSSALFEGIPQDGAVLGDPAAPVTITELSDLKCSHCRDFGLESLPVLVERYVRPGRVRLVFHNLPVLGAESQRAARAAVAAGKQDRMWPFIHRFFWDHGGEGPNGVDDVFIRRVGGAVAGLDVNRALAERDAPEVSEELAASARLAQEMHVRGVPFFMIGRTGGPARQLAVRPSEPEAFIDAIEEILAREPEAK